MTVLPYMLLLFKHYSLGKYYENALEVYLRYIGLAIFQVINSNLSHLLDLDAFTHKNPSKILSETFNFCRLYNFSFDRFPKFQQMIAALHIIEHFIWYNSLNWGKLRWLGKTNPYTMKILITYNKKKQSETFGKRCGKEMYHR